MSSTISSSSTQSFQDFLGKFHSRKLLIHNSTNHQTITATPSYPAESSLDKNVLVVLSVLICSIIVTFVLHFLIRYALSCLRLVHSESSANSTACRSINKGIKKKVLKTFPVVNYSEELKLPGLDTECVICLSEFAAGERVRFLLKCNHGFHVRCIDKWLRSNSSCPKCRHCLIGTCEKIVGSNQQTSSLPGTSVQVPEIVISIRPLEPEGIIRNCSELS